MKFDVKYASGVTETVELADVVSVEAAANRIFGLTLDQVRELGADVTDPLEAVSETPTPAPKKKGKTVGASEE